MTMDYPMQINVVVHNHGELKAVYGVLSGASSGAVAMANKPTVATAITPTVATAITPTVEHAVEAAAAHSATVQDASGTGGEQSVDAAGWPWSADMHASTKTLTKEGLWRMKIGVSRPPAKPGFEAAPVVAPAAAPATPAPAAAPATVEDEDEFASFRAAAAESNASDVAAAAKVSARKWTDADLGKLCNQAAVKMGSADPIKEVIAAYSPAGVVPHSRSIPDEKREEFAKALEAKAGIEFVG